MSGRRNVKKYAAFTDGQLQRIAAFTRADGLCEFEVAVTGLLRGETHFQRERIVEWDGDVAWSRCGARAIATCHIWRRWKCGDLPTDDGPALKYHELVVLAGCTRCHARFDSRAFADQVRPPAGMVQISKTLIEHTLAAARTRGLAAVSVDLTEFDPPVIGERVTS